ncbi:MAG: hypothetical protein H0V72_29375 [Bradyrhizobium sp.]|nr:hypothetical protein [Bradyrhizobium sp.]
MPLAVITVNNRTPALDKKAQEVVAVARAVALASQAIASAGGAVTSGNIVDDGAVVVGSWTFTPQAAS